MKLAHFVHRSIYSLTTAELRALVAKRDNNEKYECEEKQLFLHFDGNRFVAIDNTTGDLFMEDFAIENDAIIYLLEYKTSEVLHEAEKESYWW